MKISELISEVTEKDCDIENILLKIKVIARRCGRKSLEDWLDKEISGYEDKETMPEYRILDLILIGDISNGYHRYPNRRIPILHLKEEHQKILTQLEITNGIRAIQDTISKKHELRKMVQPEFFRAIGEQLSSEYHIEEAHVSATGIELQGIVSSVKRIVLDFLLEFEESMKDEDIGGAAPAENVITAFVSAETIVKQKYMLGF